MKSLTVDINILQEFDTTGYQFGFEISNNDDLLKFTQSGQPDSIGYKKTFTTDTILSIPCSRLAKLNHNLTYRNETSTFALFGNQVVTDISIDSTNKMTAVGSFNQYNGSTFNRIVTFDEANPSLANAYGVGSNNDISVVVDSGDSKFIGGSFTSFGGFPVNRLCKITNGSPALAFNLNTMNAATNKGFNVTIHAIAIQSDGKILVGGAFNNFNNNSRAGIVRLNANGTIDNTFTVGTGFGTGRTVYSIVIQSDGKILAGGDFITYNDTTGVNGLVRLNTNGTLDSSFTQGGFNTTSSGSIRTIKVLSSGDILVGGDFTTYKGNTRNGIVKINSTGTVDYNIFGTGLQNISTGRKIYNIETLPSGEILIGGFFESFNGVTRNNFIKLNSNGTLNSDRIEFNLPVRKILVTSSFVYVAGQFSSLSVDTSITSGNLYNIPFDLVDSVPDIVNVLYSNLVAYQSSYGITHSILTDISSDPVGVRVYYEFDDNDIVNISGIYDVPDYIQITYTNTSLTINDLIKEVVVRSPNIIISDSNSTFDTVDYKVRVWEGSIFTGASQSVLYNISKTKIALDQTDVFIDISNLVRENLEVNVASFLSTDFYNAKPLSSNISKWVQVDETIKNLGATVSTSVYRLYATDGYLYNDEIQGIPNVLVTGTQRYIHKNQVQRIYFQTNFLTGIFVTSQNGLTTEDVYTIQPDILGDNKNYIQSLTVDTRTYYPGNEWFQYLFTYSNSRSIRVRYNVYDYCKHEPYTLVYKNKWGVPESIGLTKKASKELNIDRVDFQRSVLDYNGNYDMNRHSSKTFNTNGKQKWTLNTDWMPEYMNQCLEEINLSEEVWLLDQDNNIIPVVIEDKKIEYKTALNDKLVNYTIVVNLSHKIIKKL